MRWSEQVSEVEFAVHYKGKEISSESWNESLPKLYDMAACNSGKTNGKHKCATQLEVNWGISA